MYRFARQVLPVRLPGTCHEASLRFTLNLSDTSVLQPPLLHALGVCGCGEIFGSHPTTKQKVCLFFLLYRQFTRRFPFSISNTNRNPRTPKKLNGKMSAIYEEPDSATEPVKVLITLHEGMTALDAVGPLEVFFRAQHDPKNPGMPTSQSYDCTAVLAKISKKRKPSASSLPPPKNTPKPHKGPL